MRQLEVFVREAGYGRAARISIPTYAAEIISSFDLHSGVVVQKCDSRSNLAQACDVWTSS